MNILFHYAAGPDLAARVAGLGGDWNITIDPAPGAATLARTDVLWHVLNPCTAAMIAAAPRLKLIQKIGVGVNTIDLHAARARAIPVCNLPGSNARAVAELTLGLMLAATRRIPAFDAATRANQGWSSPALQDGIFELGGRTVGLVGHGAIPKLLAPVLAALGCQVLVTSRAEPANPIGSWRPLENLLAEVDIVSLHLPLTPETTRMIDATAIARMRRGAVLINTARGGLVDPLALRDALTNGQLSAAGLDTFEEEPTRPDDPLLRLPNVVLTPHVAWITTDTFDRSFATCMENCRRVHAGEQLLHRVR